ncbi:hypothetical protein Bhyg_10050 [Pseudolycoriella hygida]|uniref:Uncharacterized protein n=1 Tax=Pseudolycoriella hygida TaxID=35572 RepID=A0A9Q0RX14_9DIPT|nr:hypothetical protein Bhyg_10050 [Pseudolycoriella hygida]
MNALTLAVALFFCANNVNSLELKSVQEGGCPIPLPTINLNMTWVMNNAGNVKYFGGGSEYNMYGVAALHPTFGKMRPFEFYYNSCFGANLNFTSGIGSLYGFGDLLGDFELRPGNAVTEPGAIYFVKIGQPKLTIRHQVTLTDYKSFVFFSNCWKESNQRAWGVGTFERNLSDATVNSDYTEVTECEATIDNVYEHNSDKFK